MPRSADARPLVDRGRNPPARPRNTAVGQATLDQLDGLDGHDGIARSCGALQPILHGASAHRRMRDRLPGPERSGWVAEDDRRASAARSSAPSGRRTRHRRSARGVRARAARPFAVTSRATWSASMTTAPSSPSQPRDRRLAAADRTGQSDPNGLLAVTARAPRAPSHGVLGRGERASTSASSLGSGAARWVRCNAGRPSRARDGSCTARGGSAPHRALLAGAGRLLRELPRPCGPRPGGRHGRSAARSAVRRPRLPGAAAARDVPCGPAPGAEPMRNRFASASRAPRTVQPPQRRPARPGTRRRRRRHPASTTHSLSHTVSSRRRSCDTTMSVAGQLAQEGLDGLAGRNVQVVRGLVEEQQVGRLDPEHRQLQARALAAREGPDLLGDVVAAEQEAGEVRARLARRDRDGLEQRIEDGRARDGRLAQLGEVAELDVVAERDATRRAAGAPQRSCAGAWSCPRRSARRCRSGRRAGRRGTAHARRRAARSRGSRPRPGRPGPADTRRRCPRRGRRSRRSASARRPRAPRSGIASLRRLPAPRHARPGAARAVPRARASWRTCDGCGSAGRAPARGRSLGLGLGVLERPRVALLALAVVGACSRRGTRSAGGRGAPRSGSRSRRGTPGHAMRPGATRRRLRRWSSSHSRASRSRWLVGSSSSSRSGSAITRRASDARVCSPAGHRGRRLASTRRGEPEPAQRRVDPLVERVAAQDVELVLEVRVRGVRDAAVPLVGGEGLGHPVEVGGPAADRRAEVGRGHEDRVEVGLLGEQAERQAALAQDLAPIGLVAARGEAQQRGLARAVRPNEADPVAERDRGDDLSRITNVPTSRRDARRAAGSTSGGRRRRPPTPRAPPPAGSPRPASSARSVSAPRPGPLVRRQPESPLPRQLRPARPRRPAPPVIPRRIAARALPVGRRQPLAPRAEMGARAPMTIRRSGRPQRGHGSPVRW